MKRILLMSVYDAWDYVMDHYAPAGQEEFARRSDRYAVVSIQDTHTEGFGFEFTESRYCEGVLTLYFDDIERPVDGAVLFSDEDAREIIEFVLRHRKTETLLVHCYGGESRSRAVAAFPTRMFGKDDAPHSQPGRPNRHVYDTLVRVYETLSASS